MTGQTDAIHPWLAERRAGVLLHPTSLPGPGTVGRLGAVAEAWLDRLAESGFTALADAALVSTGQPGQSLPILFRFCGR